VAYRRETPAGDWLRRVYKNSFTRNGRRVFLRGWSVKIQHQGRRHAFSLVARSRAAAAFEAKAIYQSLRAEGWDATLAGHSRRRPGDRGISMDTVEFWREHLVTRRYHFSASGQSEQDLAARISHAGLSCFMPLGSADPEKAAARARSIYHDVLERGWEPVCIEHPRELVVGFEWCSNPVIWTYTTIHTLVKEPKEAAGRPRGAAALPNLVILDADAGIRRSLAWCIDRGGDCRSVPCNSVAALPRCLEIYRPRLLLVNRALAGHLGFDLPGQLAAIPQGALALTYSVAVDGDQLFASTPGGSEGYVFKRIKPEAILEPLHNATQQLDLRTEDYQSRVRSYFRGLLRVYPKDDASGLGKLTRRERDVLQLLSRGQIDKEIAESLHISAWTVRGYVKSIFARLHVRTRTEAVARYLER